MKKKTITNQEETWICEGCGNRVHILHITKEGKRCLKCVINNKLDFVMDRIGLWNIWANNPRWANDKKGKEVIDKL